MTINVEKGEWADGKVDQWRSIKEYKKKFCFSFLFSYETTATQISFTWAVGLGADIVSL